MPAVSKAQQRFFGVVKSVAKGDTPKSKVSKEVVKAAETMKPKEVDKFAKTKTKNLPEKVKQESITKRLPERGTPDWHKLQIAKDTVKNPAKAFLGGQTLKQAKEILKQYGLSESKIIKSEEQRIREIIKSIIKEDVSKYNICDKKIIELIKILGKPNDISVRTDGKIMNYKKAKLFVDLDGDEKFI